MVEYTRVLSRISVGRAQPFSYLLIGFVGSVVVGLLVIVLFSMAGRFAERFYQHISPTFILAGASFVLTAFGLVFSGWLWNGCLEYFKKSSHWFRHIMIFLALAHAFITLTFVMVFLQLTASDTLYLEQTGIWPMGM